MHVSLPLVILLISRTVGFCFYLVAEPGHGRQSQFNYYLCCFLLYCSIHRIVTAVPSTHTLLRSLDETPVLHLPVARRGGTFSAVLWPHDHVNLTLLALELQKVENRFNATRREVKGNKLVRKPRTGSHNGNDKGVLMGEIAADGFW